MGREKKKKKKKIGPAGIIVIIGALFLIVPVIIGMLRTPSSVGKKMAAPEVTSGFDAIGRLESSIPVRMKGGMWPVSDWRQARLDEDTWRVTGDECMWKVKEKGRLCAEGGALVSVCSENGRARRYSGLPFCKPPSICGQ
jgi:hypothetical protein